MGTTLAGDGRATKDDLIVQQAGEGVQPRRRAQPPCCARRVWLWHEERPPHAAIEEHKILHPASICAVESLVDGEGVHKEIKSRRRMITLSRPPMLGGFVSPITLRMTRGDGLPSGGKPQRRKASRLLRHCLWMWYAASDSAASDTRVSGL